MKGGKGELVRVYSSKSPHTRSKSGDGSFPGIAGAFFSSRVSHFCSY